MPWAKNSKSIAEFKAKPRDEQLAIMREFLLSKIQVGGPDDCWPWLANKKEGYGTSQKSRLRGFPLFGHRLSAVIFLGFDGGDLEVCHRCDNPSCCNPSHLFIGTHAENIRDMVCKGRAARRKGVDAPGVKLTESDVRDIRRRYANGELTGAITKDYLARGVGRGAIVGICIGKNWKHVTEGAA